MRVVTAMGAACVASLALVSGPFPAAWADAAGQEQLACQLMDDPVGHDQGYQPAEYAFMVLRAKMSAEDARNVMSMAVQEYCPNHLTDLPASWR